MLAGRFAAPGGDVRTVSEAARSAPRVADPRPCDLLLDGLSALIIEGRTAAAPRLRQAIDLYLLDQVSDDDWIQWGRGATTAAFAIWDVESWLRLSVRQVERARASGALGALVLSLNLHGFGRSYCGDLEGAASVVAEQIAAREATGIRMASYGARLLAAYQGRSDPSPEMVAIEDELLQTGDGYVLEVVSLATAVLNNGLGQYADAVAAAQELAAYEFAFLGPLALVELVEAAARSGETEVADEALHRLSGLTIAGSDWAAGLEARSRALVSVGEAAEHWYTEAITCLARTPLRPDLARSRERTLPARDRPRPAGGS